MQHGVTVRAYRNEILDRFKPVGRLKTPERTQVVYVNEAIADFAVAGLKVQFAYRTTCAVVFDALRSRLRIPLVAIYQHANGGTFLIIGCTVGYFAQGSGSVGVPGLGSAKPNRARPKATPHQP